MMLMVALCVVSRFSTRTVRRQNQRGSTTISKRLQTALPAPLLACCASCAKEQKHTEAHFLVISRFTQTAVHFMRSRLYS